MPAGHAPAVQRADRLVGHDEAPAGSGPRVDLERARTEQHRILRRGGVRPEQPNALGQPAQVRERATGDAPVGSGQHGVGDGAVQRVALGVAAGEGVGIARQRATLAARALPGGGGIDLEQDRDMTAQRGARALGKHGAAAQRDDVAGAGALEQLHAQRLLARAERRLAAAVELLLDAVAQLLLEQPVGVQGLGAEHRGHVTGGRRLAGAHEAEEDERPAAQGRCGETAPRQSIRSA